MMAYDDADQTIRAYEVKRGNGQFDAGKIRSIKRDLMCVQVLLKSYARNCETSHQSPPKPRLSSITACDRSRGPGHWYVTT